jgi:prepilin-type N-terminal cleavage/methylation domain-containing protein
MGSDATDRENSFVVRDNQRHAILESSRAGAVAISAARLSPRKHFMTFCKQRGFSMIELLIVLTIVIILTGIGFITLWPALNKEHVDTAYDRTLDTLRIYRNLAITQSRNYIVTFAPAAGVVPATMTISWWQGAPPGNVRPAPVVVNTVTLPPDVDFFVQAGIPTAANGVPDGFGIGAAAIDLDYTPAGGGGGATVVFMPDGSVQDVAGNPDSGVVYLSRVVPDLYSARAITVWGATGRIRGWRLVNQAGVATWVQQ